MGVWSVVTGVTFSVGYAGRGWNVPCILNIPKLSFPIRFRTSFCEYAKAAYAP